MVTMHGREEKALFFAGLDKLGESGSEESEQGEDEVQIIKEIQILHSSLSSGDQAEPSPKRRKRRSSGSTLTSTLPTPAALRATSRSSTRLTRPKKPQVEDALSTVKRVKAGRKTNSKGDIELVPETDRIFAGLVFYFIPNNDVAKPRRTRIRAALAHGATWTQSFNFDVTHVIVDIDIGFYAAAKAFDNAQVPGDVVIVRDTWLTDSLKYKDIQDPAQSRFRLKGTPKEFLQGANIYPAPRVGPVEAGSKLLESKESKESKELNKACVTVDFDQVVQEVKEMENLPVPLNSQSDEVDVPSFASIVPETSFEHELDGEDTTCPKDRPKANYGFQCMEKNDGVENDNPNLKTIEVLQKMTTYYDRTGDHWRTTAYRKAMSALRKQKDLISTKEQALAIPQIGARLAEKIEEIVSTGRLQRFESTIDNETDQILQLFMGIYGVGLAQAKIWIAQGHRSLDDLKQKATLNANQKVGLDHYDDFQQRIPKKEVAQHAQFVQKTLHEIDRKLDIIVGGSYRRGNIDSGDIDIIVTKKDASLEHIRTLLLDSAIPQMEQAGFLKVALASSSSSSKQEKGSKWHGASCLPGYSTWRRIDLLFVPWSELGAALIYFTGNDIFNRSMRLLASRKGMRLNQHGLYKDVMRGKGRKKVNEGKLLEGHSEKKIFDLLEVPWRPPEHRKC